MSQLIIIGGPDGAGKSTVSERLCDLLGLGAIWINIWSGLKKSPFEASKSSIHDYLKKLDPMARNLLIFHSILASINDAIRAGYTYVLVDGFWYKYAVSEQAMSGDRSVFQIAEKIFQQPDHVFYLDVTPETALLRKKNVSSYEIGFAQTSDTRSEFITFQKRVREHWLRLLDLNSDWIKINTQEQSIDKIAGDIYREIFARNPA